MRVDHSLEGRRGRPRKLVRMEGDLPVEIHTAIAKRIYDLVPDHVRWKDLLEQFIIARFGDPDEAEIEALQAELDSLETERARKKIQLDEKLKEKRRKEELQKSIEIQRRYCAEAFRVLIGKIKKNHGTGVTMKEEFISKIYGISFNRHAVNNSWDELIDVQDWPDEMIIERFGIRKTERGEREDEIMRAVKAKVRNDVNEEAIL